MAGGKETPRQKMIGMMYLVLTALLAMNVSKTILKGYVRVNESLIRSRENLEKNNENITKAFEASLAGNAGSIPYFEKAKEAQKLLKACEKYIDEVKYNVMSASLDGIGRADTIQLKYVERLDNYDDPSRVLGVAEPSTPKDGPLTSLEMKEKLNKLSATLLAMLDEMKGNPKTKLDAGDYDNLKRKITDLKPHDSGGQEDGLKMTWEVENFYHMPMAAVVCNLNKTAADLASMEAEMLSVLSGASGKISIKFDNLKARVIAPSSYIQAGQQYTADIFIAASSSKISKEDMKIYVGIDSAEAAAGKTANEVPIEGGEGKYLVGTGGQGEQTYKGVIKYKNPDGTFKYYPFEQKYMVAAPSVAVSADQMRVFYCGVENPVTIGAAGVSPTDLQVSPSGGGVKSVSKGGGKFIFTFTGTGTCNVSVSAKGKSQGPPVAFKVKALPKPEMKIGGLFSPTEMKKSQMAMVGAIGAGANGFEFQANFVVQSLEVVAKVKGKPQESGANPGANFSSKAAELFKNADVNSKVYIEATIKGPDGKITNVTHAVKVLR
jgi:gliding motility-associated protein GldM